VLGIIYDEYNGNNDASTAINALYAAEDILPLDDVLTEGAVVAALTGIHPGPADADIVPGEDPVLEDNRGHGLKGVAGVRARGLRGVCVRGLRVRDADIEFIDDDFSTFVRDPFEPGATGEHRWRAVGVDLVNCPCAKVDDVQISGTAPLVAALTAQECAGLNYSKLVADADHGTAVPVLVASTAPESHPAGTVGGCFARACPYAK
jgi:hypothetical protein